MFPFGRLVMYGGAKQCGIYAERSEGLGSSLYSITQWPKGSQSTFLWLFGDGL